MPKILVIEDDRFLQKALEEKFQKEGFEVEQAFDGKEGIIKAVKQQPHFILLDLMMPVMDGTTALRHLKDMPETKDIPVAILTVVPNGVPKSTNDQEIFNLAVGFWEKDKSSITKIVKNVKEFLKNIESK